MMYNWAEEMLINCWRHSRGAQKTKKKGEIGEDY